MAMRRNIYFKEDEPLKIIQFGKKKTFEEVLAEFQKLIKKVIEQFKIGQFFDNESVLLSVHFS